MMMPRNGIRLPTRTMAGAHNSEAAAPMSNFLRVVMIRFVAEWPHPLRKPPCHGRQVGEGVSPPLDAIQNVAVVDMDVEVSSYGAAAKTASGRKQHRQQVADYSFRRDERGRSPTLAKR